ncbi:MAG: CDP-glycerol glycerophosphotransferase family protein [Idiomarina sp.]|nr:CDP-glycerol glycerophosphotransferase family protein [Idiomarina sp.]
MNNNSKRVSLAGLSVYVAPANPAARLLAHEFAQQGAHVLGFIDNLKSGEGIVNHPEELSTHDYIVVAVGAYQQAICKTLVQRGFPHHNVLLASSSGLKAFRYGWTERIRDQLHSASLKVLHWLVSCLPKVAPCKRVVYYTEDFIDNNILVAWQYHVSVSPESVQLVTRNLSRVSGASGSVLDVGSLRGRLELMRAKCIVLDHEYQGMLFDVVREHRPCIQLYHGLPYKFLAGNRHFKHIQDEAFVSSSDYFNQAIFPQLFRAKRFLALGYPRNDAFLQAAAERCWANTPATQRPQDVINATGNLWVYMPTYRDSGEFVMPFSLDAMQALCESHQRTLLLKFHPFVATKVISEFNLTAAEHQVTPLPQHPNILLFPTRMNVYPWLAEADLLITDYSSVAFDFLLADKPILFFQYDRDAYYASRGEFTVPATDFAAGPVVEDETTLFQELTQIADGSADTHKEQRHQLISKLGIRKVLASPALEQLTREIT